MPVEVELPGAGVVEFPDGMSEQQITEALNKKFRPPVASATAAAPQGPQVSATRAFTERALTGAAPGAAFVAAAGPGAAYGAELGATFGPVGAAVGGIAGGLVTGIPASWAARKAQAAALRTVAPQFAKRLEAEMALGEQQHPWASAVGDIASFGASARMAPLKLAQLPFRVGVGAAATAGQSLLTERRLPTGPELAAGVGTMAAYGEPRSLLRIARLLPRSAAEAMKGVPNASSIETPAEIHGPLRPQPVEGAGQVPPEGGGAGVRPQAAPLAKEAQIPLELTDQEQAYLDAERSSIDAPVDVTETLPSGQAFAKGHIATIDRATGRVLINPAEFSAWLKDVPEARRALAVRSLLSEERIHLAVQDADAVSYWTGLSGAEKAIERRRYTGRWRGAGADEARLLGHEAVRFRLQQLARMTPREIAEAKGPARIGMQALTALENIVRGVRERIAARASGEQLAILGRMQNNLSAARVANEVASQPAAMRKGRPAEQEIRERLLANLNGHLTDLRSELEAAKSATIGTDQKLDEIADFNEAIKSVQRQIDDVTESFGPAGPEHAFPAAIRKPASDRPEDYAAALGNVRFDSVWDPQLEGFKPMWQFTLTTPGRRTSFVTPKDASFEEVRRKAGIKNLQFEPGVHGAEEAARIWDEQEQAPGAFRKARKETSAQGMFYLPPIPKGEAVERGVSIEVPEEAGRLKITPLDIDWQQPGKQGSYRPISSAEATNPKSLGDILTQDARIGGSTLPETTTRRLTVLLDKTSGEVHIVSTYPHGRSGAMAVNPSKSGAARPNVPVADLLERYKPLYSILRDSPVKNFHQRFESFQDYQQRFGEEADQRNLESLTGKSLAETGEDALSRPEPETRQAALARVLGVEEAAVPEEVAPPTYSGSEGTPPTDAELKAFHDFFEGEIPATKYDFDRLIGVAAATASRQMAMAAHKAAQMEAKANPTASPEVNLESALSKLYDDLTKAETRGEFIQNAQSRLGEREGLARPVPERGLATAGTGRELTMRSRLPPTVVRGGPTVAPRPAPEPSVARPSPQIPPQSLAGPEMAALESKLAELYPVDPLAWEPSAALEARGIHIMPGALGERPGAKPFRLPASPRAPQRLTGQTRFQFPGAFNKAQAVATKDAFRLMGRAINASLSRQSVKRDIPMLLDAADNTAALMPRQAANAIRDAFSEVRSGLSRAGRRAMDAEANRRMTAAVAYVAADGDVSRIDRPQPAKGARPRLASFRELLDMAESRARGWVAGLNPLKSREGRLDLAKVAEMHAGLDYAKAHWNDPEFVAGAKRYKQEMDDHIAWQQTHGFNVTMRQQYIPGRYEGSYWSDGMLTLFANRLLGTNYRLPKTFTDPYQAIAAGPYRMKSLNLADLAEHRIGQGVRQVERDIWFKSLKGLKDPVTTEPIARNPDLLPIHDPSAPPNAPQRFAYASPDPNYVLVYPRPNVPPLAVRVGYQRLVEACVSPSLLEKVPLGRDLLRVNQMLKHGVILLWDTFHPGRLGQYGAALLGKNARDFGYRGGISALVYRPADLAEAVRKGSVSQAAADWATTPVQLRPGVRLTRQQLLQNVMVAQHGFNVARLSDALYRTAVESIPIFGGAYHRLVAPYNNWLFQNFIPGLMAETAVRNVEKALAANKTAPFSQIVGDVVRDTNIFFGNMGRQGVLKSRTLQEFAQLAFLAPAWQEGLFQKELRFTARLGGAAARRVGIDLPYRRGLPALGTLGEGMARGLGAYLVGTQLINLVTRGHFTWQNPEEGHKLDAWLPFGNGMWLSPMSVFAEVTHDIIRLAESKPTVMDGINQVGENRLSPVAKMALILKTGEDPRHRRYTTSMGRIGGSLSQITPFVGAAPISFAVPARAIGHAVAPSMVSPNQPGALPRQLLATLAGTKTQPAEDAAALTGRMARDFMRREGLDKTTGWKEVQTTDPSYSKLRGALRIGDTKAAASQYRALVDHHTPEQIHHAMTVWARRDFTGSHQAETLFKLSMDRQQQEIYAKAQDQRMEELLKFEDFYLRQP